MNEQLIKFIELCLIDGVISDKEREVIFRKSKELGVPDDECEIILEGMIGMSNNEETSNEKEETSNENNINKDLDVKESYVNLETPQDWFTKLNTLNEIIQEFLNSENEKIKTFIKSGDFKKSLQKSPFVFERNILDSMINQPRTEKGGFFSSTINSSTLEWEVRDQIKNILDVEEFYGYTPFNGFLVDQKELNEKIEHQSKINLGDKEYWESWCFSIFTNKGIHTFIRHRDRSNDTYKYREKTSYEKMKNGFISYESLKEQHENLRVNFSESLWEPPILYSRFLFLHSEDFKIKPLILNLKLTFDDDEFIEKVSSLNLNDEDLNNLMRIHNFITRSINEHNIGLDKFNISNIYNINLILNSEKSTTNTKCNNFDNIKNLIHYHKDFISITINLLKIRDVFLNYLIKNDTVNSKKIVLKLEDLGVLNTKFERDLLNSLENIGNQLSLLNKNILSMTEILTGHLQSIENKLEIQNNKLSEVSGQLSYNNLISTINTYQVLKINKNTKSLN